MIPGSRAVQSLDEAKSVAGKSVILLCLRHVPAAVEEEYVL